MGVVLAGGASRRMGRDKALLKVDGRRLVARAADVLAAVCSEVLAADAGRGYLDDEGVASVPDGPGRGPVAGLLGAAAARPGRPLLALACDLPGVTAPLLAELVKQAHSGGDAPGGPYDWVVPRGDRGLEPLAALYGPAALDRLVLRVEGGRFDLHGLAAEPGLAVLEVAPEKQARFGDPARLFRNLNEPRDL